MEVPVVIERIGELLDGSELGTSNTSMRIPTALRDAAALAVRKLGIAPSTTALTTAALRAALESVVIQAALDDHYEQHPQARPDLGDLAICTAIHSERRGRVVFHRVLPPSLEPGQIPPPRRGGHLSGQHVSLSPPRNDHRHVGETSYPRVGRGALASLRWGSHAESCRQVSDTRPWSFTYTSMAARLWTPMIWALAGSPGASRSRCSRLRWVRYGR
jgi:hypothetical protein